LLEYFLSPNIFLIASTVREVKPDMIANADIKKPLLIVFLLQFEYFDKRTGQYLTAKAPEEASGQGIVCCVRCYSESKLCHRIQKQYPDTEHDIFGQ
jgi:hypothetical protein